MDTFAHGLAGALIFSRSGYAGLIIGRGSPDTGPGRFDWTIPSAALFGMLPDLMSFGNIAFRHIFSGGRGRPPIESIPDWVYTAYDMTHSLLIVSVLVILLFLADTWLGISACAWLLHVVCDIPTHSREFFPTPFLYPLSDFTVDGVPFMHPSIFASYWGFLIAAWALLLWLRHRNKPASRTLQP